MALLVLTKAFPQPNPDMTMLFLPWCEPTHLPLSVNAEPISQGHCRSDIMKLESLMMSYEIIE